MQNRNEVCIAVTFVVATVILMVLAEVSKEVAEKTRSCRINSVEICDDNATAFANVTVLQSGDEKNFAVQVFRYCDGVKNVTECLSSFLKKYEPVTGTKTSCYVPRRSRARDGVYLYSPNNALANDLYIAGWVIWAVVVVLSGVYAIHGEAFGKERYG